MYIIPMFRPAPESTLLNRVGWLSLKARQKLIGPLVVPPLDWMKSPWDAVRPKANPVPPPAF